MGRFAQLVIGPAGCGKSTYCHALINHMHAGRRSAIAINLDPAAEKFHYQPTIDIRDLVTLEDVMEEMELGPNGGLMYCMEYLVDNVDWLEEEIGTDFEDEYVVIDCPGQIELYTHSPVMTQLVRALTDRLHFRVCVVYLLEAQFINDVSKYFSGTLTAMAAMVQLELPHINVLSKMDLVEGRPGELQKLPNVKDGEQSDERNGEKISSTAVVDPDAPKSGYVNTWTEDELQERDQRRDDVQLERYLEPDRTLLIDRANADMGSGKWRGLNEAIAGLIDDFSMVAFQPLNIHDEDSLERILLQVDIALQYGEDAEPKDPLDGGENEEGEDEGADYDVGEGTTVEQSWREMLSGDGA